MREKGPPDAPIEAPTWFFTYTDVITLLMTFFVLLLTFATSEPEKFERMQVALFGGGGGTGIAGEAKPLDEDTLLMRERPRSSRMTSRGSEMPPIHSDPSVASLAAGLEGLDEEPTAKVSDSYAFEMPVSRLVSSDGEVTSVGAQRLRMFARRLRKGTHRVTFEVSRESEVDRCMVLCQHLIKRERIKPGQVAVGVVDETTRSSKLRIVLTYNPLR